MHLPLFSRRQALHTLVAVGTAAWAGGVAAQALTPQAALWRVSSRLGYGPHPALLAPAQSATSVRAWAAQQVDVALAASRTPAWVAAPLAGFNRPLPEIFAGAKAEREARQVLRANTPEPTSASSMAQGTALTIPEPEHFSRNMAQQTAVWRLASCSQPLQEPPLLARMTEFWFNHFNVYIGKAAVRPFVGHYVLHVARAHALGKFEDLLLASARHPAMLLYLDQARSVAHGSPSAQGMGRGMNENYARELLELHTLGVQGGYSQDDVREMARILTGWNIGPEDASGFRFAARAHDNGSKRLLGQVFSQGLWSAGVAEGEGAIRMLARHPSTARRVCLRLAQFLVCDTPSSALIQALCDVFLATQGDMAQVLRTLLAADDFWDPANRLFKTPLDYACSALTVVAAAGDPQDLVLSDPVAGTVNRRTLAWVMDFLANAGQALHGWQTPDGYPSTAAHWMVPEALTRRADFAMALGRNTPAVDFLRPFLRESTLHAIDAAKPSLQAGLMLASADFMFK